MQEKLLRHRNPPRLNKLQRQKRPQSMSVANVRQPQKAAKGVPEPPHKALYIAGNMAAN